MILNILSSIYQFFVNKRNKKFDKGKIKLTQTKAKVISIGNLIAGGTGKTPLTIKLVNLLKNQGYKVGVVGRGYGRKSKELIILDNNLENYSSDITGDEMLLIAKKTNLPVAIFHRKYIAAKELDSKYNLDIILIDDGFQHRYLHRDIDIILINNETINNPNTIPKGYLREPLQNYNRADFILLENGINKDKINFEKSKIHFYDKKTNKVRIISKDNENYLIKYNLKVLLTCSIANPKNFLNFVDNLGFEVAKQYFYKDHYNYEINDINNIISDCKQLNIKHIITTEKDLIKLKNYFNVLFQNEINILIIEIDIEIENETQLLQTITNLLNFK